MRFNKIKAPLRCSIITVAAVSKCTKQFILGHIAEMLKLLHAMHVHSWHEECSDVNHVLVLEDAL